MYANYHTHTKFCNHARDEMRDYVETAIKRGVKILGFSDHSPHFFPDGYRSRHMLPEQAEDYVNSVLKLREEYKDEIEILLGFEMEYYPKLFEDTLRLLTSFPCDFLILGQHFLNNEYDGVRVAAKVVDYVIDNDFYRSYTEQVIEAIKTGVFSYIAHPDMARFSDDCEFCCEETERLCKCAKEHNIPLEINLLGIRDNRWYSNDKFWEIAAKVGNDVVLGCDAHDAKWVCDSKNVADAMNYAGKFGITPIKTVNLIKPSL